MSLQQQSRQSDHYLNKVPSENPPNSEIVGHHQSERGPHQTSCELEWSYISKEGLASIYFTLDSAGVVLAVNPVGAAYLRYSPEELLEQPVFRIFYQKDKKKLQSEFAAFVQEPKRVMSGRFNLLTKDGGKLLVKVSAQTLQGIAANKMFLLTCEEVTEHRQVETGLQQTEEFYHLLAAVSPVGIFHADAEGHYLHVNDRWSEIAGITAAEAQRDGWVQALHPDDKERVFAQWYRAARENLSFQSEYRFQHPDGKTIWVLGQARQEKTDTGAVIGYVGTLSDITARKQVEASLQESEERYRQLVELCPEGIFIERGGKFVFVNHAAIKFYGATNSEELIGKSVLDFVHPEYREIVLAWMQKLRKDNKEFPLIEEKWFRLDGTVVDAEAAAIPFTYQGKPAIQVVLRDITKRKQVEERLRQRFLRERALNQVVQAIRNSLDLDTIFTTAVEEIGKLLRVDRAIIIQYLPEQKLWLSVADYRHDLNLPVAIGLEIPDEGNEIAAQLKRSEVVSINDTNAVEDKITRDIAKTFPGAWLLVPLHLHSTVWGSLSLLVENRPYRWQDSDIELTRAAADQLAIAIQQSELFRQVQQLNTNLDRQVKARTAELQLAFEFEDTLKRITDRVRDSLDEGQILQTAMQELATAIGVECCNAALYDLDRGDSTICYEYTTSICTAQGRVFHMADLPEIYTQLLQGHCYQFCSVYPNIVEDNIAILACPIFDDRGVLGDLWLINHKYYAFHEQDIRLVQQVANQCAIAIRQARLYQAAQAQVKELEKLNHLKDDFLNTVSHELRTPMASIKMAIQMLEILLEQESLLNAEHSQVIEYFEVLHDECQREINLIDDLLDLSRLDAETEPLILTTIDSPIWIKSIVESFIERARSQHQSLQVDIPDELPCVTTDLSYLDRILNELLNNACKYTPSGEQITISARATATTLQLSVKNSGVEISAEQLPHIFDKFYRLPNSDPWKHGGTGLGLALVKKMVEHLGATIQAESYSGQITFTLALPLSG